MSSFAPAHTPSKSGSRSNAPSFPPPSLNANAMSQQQAPPGSAGGQQHTGSMAFNSASPPASHRLSITESHRLSFTESLRSVPSSPHHARGRHPSMNSQAFQELLNNPPVPHKKSEESKILEGREWRSIKVGEVIDPQKVRFATLDSSVEEVTETLINGGSPNVVLVRHNSTSRVAFSTFDYSDLNAYLLIAVGITPPPPPSPSPTRSSNSASHNRASTSSPNNNGSSPPPDPHTCFTEIIRKGREGKPVTLRDLKDLGRRDPFITLPDTASLRHATEIFGSGIHRIIVTKEGSQDTVGVLTQLRLVEFFWENGRNFPEIEPLFPMALKDVNIGSKSVKAINGDRPLTDALELMNNESITSLPVLDNNRNVVGNISHVDVRLLTKTTALPLLRSSCIHFISVILSERGVNDGKDSFPVFYVTPYSTLAHTAAKLVATRSHRMWLVDAPSPASSAPPTPVVTAAHPALNLGPGPSANGPPHGPVQNSGTAMPYTATSGPSVTASSIPGQHMSGRLTGVVSLTDVLNLFARATGLQVANPEEARRWRRRRSSSSSSGVSGSWTSGHGQGQGQARGSDAASRPSADSARSSSTGIDLKRSGSGASGKR